LNSFQDLNNYSSQTVTFQSQADYAIVWGNSLGNGSITANTSVYHTLQNRQPIVSFVNPLEPLVVAINTTPDAEGNPLQNVSYSGNNANIVITHPDDTVWIATGMNTVADYNELFANGIVTINLLRTQDFNYQTTISDQLGQTRNFYTIVDVVPFGFSRPNTVSFDEDANAIIDGMSLTDIANQNYTFTFSLAPTAAGNIQLNATSAVGNVLTLTGNRTSINTTLAGNITFIPNDDYASNANVVINIFNNTTSQNLGNSNILLQIGTTHVDSTWPDAITYARAGNIQFNSWSYPQNFQVTDLAQNRNYSVVFNLGNTVIGNLYTGNTLSGSSVTLTGNRTSVNSQIANIKLVPNGIANSNAVLQFTQTQTTANIVQANVAIPVTYQAVAVHAYDSLDLPIGQYWFNTGNATYQSTANTNFAISTWANTSYPATQANTATTASRRQTTAVKYSPTCINLGQLNGVHPTRTYKTAGDSMPAQCYFAFWLFNSQSYLNIHACAMARSDQIMSTRPIGPPYPVLGNLNLQFYQNKGYLTTFRYVVDSVYFSERLELDTFAANTWYHIAIQVASNQRVSAWVNGQPKTAAWSGSGLNNPSYSIPYITCAIPNCWSIGKYGYTAGGALDSSCNLSVDDIVYRDDNPQTPGVAFTPAQLGAFTGNVRMQVTGI
jgi:hypothetical protein